VRERCAEVAARARFVQIDAEGLERLARAIPAIGPAGIEAPRRPASDDPEVLAAWVLTLDAINYGSGYFPWLRKLPGKSGYRTVEARLLEHFQRHGPLSAPDLRGFDAEGMAALLGQQPLAPPIDELMALYARGWHDLGELVEGRAGGSFVALVADARGSAEALVKTLLAMPQYRDVAHYDDLLVPFLKRAQITVADLAWTLPPAAGRFHDRERLTIFADNVVPHVLRLDGVLVYEADLLERIEREEPVESGAPEEVELRACAVHAVERLVELLRQGATITSAAALDAWLWQRGAGPAYKARPRHRTRCTYY
jgi:hypothetical protein